MPTLASITIKVIKKNIILEFIAKLQFRLISLNKITLIISRINIIIITWNHLFTIAILRITISTLDTSITKPTKLDELKVKITEIKINRKIFI